MSETGTKTCENFWYMVQFHPYTRRRKNCSNIATEVVHSDVYELTFHACARCAKVLRAENALFNA